jgi:hypothetical protein
MSNSEATKNDNVCGRLQCESELSEDFRDVECHRGYCRSTHNHTMSWAAPTRTRGSFYNHQPKLSQYTIPLSSKTTPYDLTKASVNPGTIPSAPIFCFSSDNDTYPQPHLHPKNVTSSTE